jgi:hypothetical protein
MLALMVGFALREIVEIYAQAWSSSFALGPQAADPAVEFGYLSISACAAGSAAPRVSPAAMLRRGRGCLASPAINASTMGAAQAPNRHRTGLP